MDFKSVEVILKHPVYLKNKIVMFKSKSDSRTFDLVIYTCVGYR